MRRWVTVKYPSETTARMPEIIVAVDGHPHAAKVADTGVMIAKAMAAKVLLVFVIKEKHEPNGYIERQEDYDEDKYDREVGMVLDRISNSKVEVEKVWGEGDPKKFILATAKQRGASMIVMGIHPRKNVGKLLAIGDVARNVVESSKVPVLIVP